MYEYQGTFTLQVTPDLLPLLQITALVNLGGYGMSLFNTQYWPRTLEETFEGSGDSEGSGNVQGWFVEIHGVNHTPPLGVVNARTARANELAAGASPWLRHAVI